LPRLACTSGNGAAARLGTACLGRAELSVHGDGGIGIGVVAKGELCVGLVGQYFGQPPVHYLHLAVCAHHHVGRLQIAVHDAPCVRIAHGVAHLLKDGDETAQPICRRLPVLEQVAQRVALDELHGQKGLAVGERAQVVGGRNARVLQLAGDRGLDAEARGGQRIGRHFGLEQLDGHVAIEDRIACAADHAHAACADLLGQFVTAC
jgi:hypothetical protein